MVTVFPPTGTYKNHRLTTGKDSHSGMFSNDPDHRRSGKDVDLGALRPKDSNPLEGLEPTGIFAQDPNPNPAPGITIYPVAEDGGPDASRPTFILPDGTVVNSSNRARRQVSVPDGIYPAFGVTHTRTLNPTGVFTVGQVPDGIYSADVVTHTHTLKPTGIFTAGHVPDGIYPAGGITHTRTLKPTGVFTTGRVPDGIYPAAGFSIG